MKYDIKYSKEKAPKVGLVTNAIGAFSLDGKIEAENQFGCSSFGTTFN